MIEILDNEMSRSLEENYYSKYEVLYFKLKGREEKSFKDTIIYEVMTNFDIEEGTADYAHYTIENDGKFGSGQNNYDIGDWNLEDFNIWLLTEKEEIDEAKKEILCISLNCSSDKKDS